MFVSGAMGDAGPHDRQARRDIDSPASAEQFHGDMSLIVVHRHDAIEPLPPMRKEDRIRRDGANHVDPFYFCQRNRWCNDVSFFCAEQPTITGMRIESHHPNARLFINKIWQNLIQ